MANPTFSIRFANDPTSTVILPFNPNSLNWQYRLNKISIDTYGGRVTQLLSVLIETMSIQGEAGSRAALLNLFEKLKALQLRQISNQQSLVITLPNHFAIYVWFKNINLGWDPTTVTYPYDLTFEVEDVGGYGALTDFIMNMELFNMANIGTNPALTGIGTQNQAKINYSTVFG